MSKKTYPLVTWKSLTPARLRELAGDIADGAHDMEIDRDHIIEERGVDRVGEHYALERFLLREAKRRETKAAEPIKYTGRRTKLKLRPSK